MTLSPRSAALAQSEVLLPRYRFIRQAAPPRCHAAAKAESQKPKARGPRCGDQLGWLAGTRCGGSFASQMEGRAEGKGELRRRRGAAGRGARGGGRLRCKAPLRNLRSMIRTPRSCQDRCWAPRQPRRQHCCCTPLHQRTLHHFIASVHSTGLDVHLVYTITHSLTVTSRAPLLLPHLTTPHS